MNVAFPADTLRSCRWFAYTFNLRLGARTVAWRRYSYCVSVLGYSSLRLDGFPDICLLVRMNTVASAFGCSATSREVLLKRPSRCRRCLALVRPVVFRTGTFGHLVPGARLPAAPVMPTLHWRFTLHIPTFADTLPALYRILLPCKHTSTPLHRLTDERGYCLPTHGTILFERQ